MDRYNMEKNLLVIVSIMLCLVYNMIPKSPTLSRHYPSSSSLLSFEISDEFKIPRVQKPAYCKAWMPQLDALKQGDVVQILIIYCSYLIYIYI